MPYIGYREESPTSDNTTCLCHSSIQAVQERYHAGWWPEMRSLSLSLHPVVSERRLRFAKEGLVSEFNGEVFQTHTLSLALIIVVTQALAVSASDTGILPLPLHPSSGWQRSKTQLVGPNSKHDSEYSDLSSAI